jgi:probable HAF family extracellular repeat protein
VAGLSEYSASPYATGYATEWRDGTPINLGGLPGSTYSEASAINNRGEAVGASVFGNFAAEYATEWRRGSAINLGGLPGYAYSSAFAINDHGTAVGYSEVGGTAYATEWRRGSIVNLGCLPGAKMGCYAYAINDAGQVVGTTNGYTGYRSFDGEQATEWNDGTAINLGGPPGYTASVAFAINDHGQVVGASYSHFNGVPEPPTWAMLLLGFAGLGFAGYRRARAGRPVLAA